MTIKDYLTQIRRQRHQIQQLQDERKQFISEMDGIHAQNLESPRVSGTKNADIADIIIRLEQYSDMINERIGKLIEIRINADREISIIPDPVQQSILRYRYLQGYSWDDIADKIGYARSTVFLLHDAAMIELNSRLNRTKTDVTKVI